MLCWERLVVEPTNKTAILGVICERGLDSCKTRRSQTELNVKTKGKVTMNPRSQTQQLTVGRLLLAVVLALFIGFSPTSTPTAQANAGYAYYWSVTFDFENNLNGALYVAVGHAANGTVQNPPVYSESFAVPCQRVGKVNLSGGTALFQGGYLACTLDVKSALQAAFVKCNDAVPGCTIPIDDVEKYRSFRLLAEVPATAGGSIPLFYHADAAYTVAPAVAQVTAALTPLGNFQSVAMPAAPTYQARYQCGLAGPCAMEFAVGGNTQLVPLGSDAVQFFTPSSTIYIGYNPATVTTIPAGTQIAHLFVDPPNLGNN